MNNSVHVEEEIVKLVEILQQKTTSEFTNNLKSKFYLFLVAVGDDFWIFLT